MSDDTAEAENVSGTADATGDHQERWTYIGMRGLRGSGTGYFYLRPGGREFGLKKRLLAVSIGTVITVTVSGQDSVFVGGAKGPRITSERHGDVDDLARWVTADDLARGERDHAALVRKSAQVKPLDALLGDLERVAGNLNRRERMALLTRIQEAVWSA